MAGIMRIWSIVKLITLGDAKAAPSLNASKQRPGNGVDCARVFVAPKSGAVRVTGAPVCVGTPH